MLSRFSQPIVCNFACAYEIANGFMCFIRHPYRRQRTLIAQKGNALNPDYFLEDRIRSRSTCVKRPFNCGFLSSL